MKKDFSKERRTVIDISFSDRRAKERRLKNDPVSSDRRTPLPPTSEEMLSKPIISNREDFWDSPESLRHYSVEPFLYPGELKSLTYFFNDSSLGRHVLDLGCGAGRTTYFLSKMGADVIGVDISHSLIRSALERLSDIDFRPGDATQLAFEKNTFDLILFSFNGLDAIYPASRRVKALHEVWRTLKPRGLFIFSSHNLSALLFGWYKSLRPKKLLFRAKHIVNGNFFKDDCYLKGRDATDMMTYYAWPNKVIANIEKCGFKFCHLYPNSKLLSVIQNLPMGKHFAKLCDPWPYYVFRKN